MFPYSITGCQHIWRECVIASISGGPHSGEEVRHARGPGRVLRLLQRGTVGQIEIGGCWGTAGEMGLKFGEIRVDRTISLNNWVQIPMPHG